MLANSFNYVIFAFQVYRHGDRTPSAEFPTDPTPGIWPQGFGELTNVR